MKLRTGKMLPALLVLFLAQPLAAQNGQDEEDRIPIPDYSGTASPFAESPGGVLGSLFAGSGQAIGTGNARTIASRIAHMEDYRPVPGDVYMLVIDFGFSSATSGPSIVRYELSLQQDYTLQVPIIGSIDISGLNYRAVRDRIISGIQDRVPAQFVDFTLTSPAVFGVFAYGQVESPGTFDANSFTRLAQFIASTGDIPQSASLRRVQLQRDGSSESYDLVRYAAEGDMSENPYVRPGDQVFVPVAQRAVSLTGAVRSPGRFEIREGETLEDVVRFAGGYDPTAQLDEITVRRLNENNQYELRRISAQQASDFELRAGDRIVVPSSLQTTERVVIEGAVYGQPVEETDRQTIPDQPIRITIPYQPGLSMLSVLQALGGPTPFAKTDESYLLRGDTGERVDLSDLQSIWESRDYGQDIALRPGDKLVIPMMNTQVFVGGEVNNSDSFPFTSGAVVADYLKLARGVAEETGDEDRIFFIDDEGNRERVSLQTEVAPGTFIYVGKNGWTRLQESMGDFFTITGWVTGLISAATAVINFINLVQ